MMDFDWAYLFEISLTGIAGGGLYALAALAFEARDTLQRSPVAPVMMASPAA